jgi:thiamine biosynthesis lipoprotein
MNRPTLARARPLLGTVVDIRASGDSAEAVHTAIAAAFAAVERIHAAMSYHDPASELSRVNRAAPGEWLELSPDLASVMRFSKQVSRASDGLFDPTVAPVLCGMGYLPRHGNAPRVSGQGTWRDIELAGNRLRMRRRVRIDLGGIAKGYAVDQALAVLKAAGMAAARVNAGGDLALFAPQAEDVHVRHPRDPARLIRVARLAAGGIATSAGYFQACRRNGRWVTPLVHPRTRECLCLADSVSVVAPDCMTADALTKVVAADPAGAPAVIEHFGAQAIRLDPEGPLLRAFTTLPHGTWRAQWLPDMPRGDGA